jgi:hypothetical protein
MGIAYALSMRAIVEGEAKIPPTNPYHAGFCTSGYPLGPTVSCNILL